MSSIFVDWISDNPYSAATMFSTHQKDKTDQTADNLISRLKWASTEIPRAKAIAQRLDSCLWTALCLSGICPRCVRVASARFTSAIGNLDCSKLKHVKLFALTIILGEHAVEMGALSLLDLDQLKRHLRYRFDCAGVGLVLGCLELDALEHCDGDFSPVWMPHLHALAEVDDLKRIRRPLKRAFPTSEIVCRPIKIVPWDGSLAWPSYCMKLRTERRLTRTEQHQDGHRIHRRRTTTTWRLRSEQLVELAEFLDAEQFDARFSYGVLSCTQLGMALRCGWLENGRDAGQFTGTADDGPKLDEVDQASSTA